MTEKYSKLMYYRDRPYLAIILSLQIVALQYYNGNKTMSIDRTMNNPRPIELLQDNGNKNKEERGFAGGVALTTSMSLS